MLTSSITSALSVRLVTPAFFVNAGDLAIEYGVFDLQMFGNPDCKVGETAKHISIPRNELAFASEMCACAVAVDLQLEEIVRRNRTVRDGGKAAWGIGYGAFRQS